MRKWLTKEEMVRILVQRRFGLARLPARNDPRVRRVARLHDWEWLDCAMAHMPGERRRYLPVGGSLVEQRAEEA